MIRLVAVAFVLAVATSAQAMSPAPLHQPDGMTTQARQARQLPPCDWNVPGQVRIWGCPRCGADGICMLSGTSSPGPPLPREVLRLLRRYRTEPGGHNKGQGSNKVCPV